MSEGDLAGAMATPIAQRIGTMTQINGALARIQKGGLPLLLLFVITAALSAGLHFSAQAMSVDLETPSLTGGHAAFAGLDGLIGALGMSIGFRLMLEGFNGRLRLDRGLAESTVLLALATIGFTAISLFLMVAPASNGAPASGEAILRVTGALLGYAILTWLSLKLALWPAGRNVGRLEVTPARSWRLMRKATRGYFLALSLGVLPMIVVIMLAAQIEGFDTASGPITSLASTVVGAAYGFYGQALLATLFALRVEAPTSVASVFD